MRLKGTNEGEVHEDSGERSVRNDHRARSGCGHQGEGKRA